MTVCVSWLCASLDPTNLSGGEVVWRMDVLFPRRRALLNSGRNIGRHALRVAMLHSNTDHIALPTSDPVRRQACVWVEGWRFNIQLVSTCDISFNLVWRIILITQMLDSILANWTLPNKRNAYKPPSRKIAVSWIFCLVEIFNAQSLGMGSARMITSVAMLNELPTMKTSSRLIQRPTIDLFQIALIGTHWSTTQKNCVTV